MAARSRTPPLASFIVSALAATLAAIALTPGVAAELDGDFPAIGEFHFARMIYTDLPQYRGFGGGWWQQDYPRAEAHLLVTLERYTRIHVAEPVAVRLTDDTIF